MSKNIIDVTRSKFLLRKEIEEAFQNGYFESAKTKFYQNKNNFNHDIDWYMLETALLYREGRYKEAKNILLEKYAQHEWNFDVNYNLGLFCFELADFENSIKYFTRCLLHRKLTDDFSKNITDLIEKMCTIDSKALEYYKLYGEKELSLKHHLYTNFPEKVAELNDPATVINYIGDKFKIGDAEYYCGISDRYSEERNGLTLYNKARGWMLYKTEVLKGQMLKKFKYFTDKNTVLGLMPLKQNQIIKIEFGSTVIKLDKLLKYHYYYYNFDKYTKIEISSDDGFVISDPIPLIYQENKPKLIVNLFIDGLSQKYFDVKNLKELMPITYKFFEEGTICQQVYSNSEWTYPSLASTFTGRRTLGKTGHRLFHGEYSSENLNNMELFPEILHKHGYLCTRIDGDWTSTPNSGSMKGIDRFLYEPSKTQMFAEDVLMELIEHLEAFQGCSNFVWAGINDLHDTLDEYESTISTQINTNIKYRKIEHSKGTSVRKVFNKSKIIRYEAQLKRLDVLLGLFYSYVKENYAEEEYIISLMSDHGQGIFIRPEDEFFDEYRNKAVMMYRGSGIPKGNCNALMESIDFFPVLMHCAGIENFDCKEGIIPKWFLGSRNREYSLSESIFPGSPYYAVINDPKYQFFFTTEKDTSDEGYLDLTECKVKLIEKASKVDVTDREQILIDKYTKIVIEHITEYIGVI